MVLFLQRTTKLKRPQRLFDIRCFNCFSLGQFKLILRQRIVFAVHYVNSVPLLREGGSYSNLTITLFILLLSLHKLVSFHCPFTSQNPITSLTINFPSLHTILSIYNPFASCHFPISYHFTAHFTSYHLTISYHFTFQLHFYSLHCPSCQLCIVIKQRWMLLKFYHFSHVAWFSCYFPRSTDTQENKLR